MERSALVFAIAVSLALLLLAVFSLPEPPQSHGAIHPKYATMEHGGDSVERSGHVLWLGWGLGVLQIALFVSMIALAASPCRGLRGLGLPLVLAGLCFASVWTALVLSYRAYAMGAETALFLGFPAPTAWLLFGIWPVPILFVAFYALGFDRWVVTPRELTDLEARLEQLRRDSETERGED